MQQSNKLLVICYAYCYVYRFLSRPLWHVSKEEINLYFMMVFDLKQ